MSTRRSLILRVARETGAYWRMSGTARGYLAEEAPGLYRVLEELSEITKEEPNARAYGGLPLGGEAGREAEVPDGAPGTGKNPEG